MSDDDFGFQIPAFRPDAALQTLQRQLRELGLSARAGVHELRGQPVVAVEADPASAVLHARVARRPSRTPDWDPRILKDHADLRRLLDDVKKRLADWSDTRGES